MFTWFKNLNPEKKIKGILISLFLILGVAYLPFLVQVAQHKVAPTELPDAAIIANQNIGASGDATGQWTMFNRFTGYSTKSDPQKIDVGANPVGQNTYINDGDRISVRDFGYELYPSTATESGNNSPITSMHTFRKRDGTNILLGSYGATLQYYIPKIAQWEILKTGFTTSTFGFADQNTNSDQTAYVYFGNAVESYQRWTGNVAKLTSAVSITDVTINVDDTTGFPAAGTIIFCGTTTAYSAKTATTFTITAATVGCASARGVAQVPQEFTSAPRGNILMVMQTRMFIAGVASSTQTLFYSKIADATDFTFSSPRVANDGGVINMPEGGGGIVGMIEDQGALYVFKQNIIKSVTFSQDGNDLPTILPLKPFSDRSQTVGAKQGSTIFTGANGTFFVTPNNEILHLAQIPNIIYPQAENISDIISPSVDTLDFSSMKGVFFKNKAYFAAKQNSTDLQNNIVLVYNTEKKAWESPIIGVDVGDWAIANLNSSNLDELYFGSAYNSNVFLVNNTPVDNGYAVTANWRSREETFGHPEALKSIDNFYVEGYISDNTQLSISLLLDENGFTQTQTTILVGNEQVNKFLFTKLLYNQFGLNPFGFERFGTNKAYSSKKKFRVYLAGNLKRIPFYSIQVEFASNNPGDQWEILQYGYHLVRESQEMRTGLIRNW